MSKVITRLKSVKIHRIKNVEYGEIFFNSSFDNLKKADILGIYGQNGSGKTAFVNAMQIVKRLFTSTPLSDDVYDLISTNAQDAQIELEFYHFNGDEIIYHIFYDVTLRKPEERTVKVVKENLKFKKLKDGKWTNKVSLFQFDYDEKEFLKPRKNVDKILKNNSDKLDLEVIKRLIYKRGESFIFNFDFLDVLLGLNKLMGDNLEAKSENELNDLSEDEFIVFNLFGYALTDLIIVDNKYFGMVNSDSEFFFDIKNKFIREKLKINPLNINIVGTTLIPKSEYDRFSLMIKQMNIVLEKIIPNLNIGLKKVGEQLMPDAKTGVLVELVSEKNGHIIPIRYESDGIKKIISILSMLISVYNNPECCLIVDELDASIFEYLLGEIIEVIKEFGKGQLIFTSHNLRPLEVLDSKSIVFTTVNPENRYMKFKGVKTCNNLRDLYYRSINLGGQSEDVYEPTADFEISRAFKQAGRNQDGKN